MQKGSDSVKTQSHLVDSLGIRQVEKDCVHF